MEKGIKMEIKINISDGKSGDWEVSTFEVSEKDANFHNLRASFHPGARMIKPGRYKKLTRNGSIVMSNTQSEINDLLHFIHIAKNYGGNILINGLGLGVALTAILKYKNIINITVIEKSANVIKLVAPSFANDKRINIIHANAFEWKAPKGIRYTVVWHDIWKDICSDNLPEMTKLHRKYGRRCDWQGSWCKELHKQYR